MMYPLSLRGERLECLVGSREMTALQQYLLSKGSKHVHYAYSILYFFQASVKRKRKRKRKRREDRCRENDDKRYTDIYS